MAGQKFKYLLLCSILVASGLISDVNARSSKSSHHHTSHVSHASPHHSNSVSSHSSVNSQHHSYPASPGHTGSSHGSVNSQHHSYPASPGHSGNTGGSTIIKHNYLQTQSNPRPHLSGTSQPNGYPAAPPSSMSGGGSSSGHSYPPTNTISGSVARPGNVLNTPPNYMSGGGSGSSGHSYPTTNTMSGSGARPGNVLNTPPNSMSGGGSGSSGHSYPQTNTMSGSGARPGNVLNTPPNYISGGGSGSSGHSYPQTNTMSGSGARPGYVPTGTHNTNGGTRYPQNPSINTHQSTSWGSNQPVHHVHTSSHTVHHHHYIYRPPTAIHYTTSYGVSPVSYPIYTGRPPPYVYEYRSSGNKYSYLLAGLALYNLGRISSTPRANYYHEHYIPKQDEYCRFGVRYRTGAVEEMNIDCRAITYFIFEADATQPQMLPQTQTHVSTNIVNQTTVTTQTMLPNGTLVSPVNTQTQVNAGNGVVVPNIQQVLSGNGAVIGNAQQVNTVTTTTTQVVSVTDSRLSGKPVQVNPEMECYVTRITTYNMQKPVPCGLLQEYAKSSFRISSAVIAKSSLTLIVIAVAFLLY